VTIYPARVTEILSTFEQACYKEWCLLGCYAVWLL
jgi:hypothetical protein